MHSTAIISHSDEEVESNGMQEHCKPRQTASGLEV